MGTEGHSCYYFRFEFLFYIFRWSHAERLLAIDQLIDTCEPQQVRHMMQVSTRFSSVCLRYFLQCNVLYLLCAEEFKYRFSCTRFITLVKCSFVCYGSKYPVQELFFVVQSYS